MRLFKRTARVTIASPANKDFFGEAQNALVVDGLRIAFSIEMSLETTPNTCWVSVYNLSADTRKLLQSSPLIVRLDGGYDGSLSRIFAGDVRFAQSKRSGPDWETRFQLADGDRAYRSARLSRSYPSGTQPITVCSDLADSMGLELPRLAFFMRELTRPYAIGMSVTGSSQAELTRVLRACGVSWSIQYGQLQFLRKSDAAVGVERATTISQEGGMIGSPEFGTPTEEEKIPTLMVNTLLDTQNPVFPGSLIFVKSNNIQGGLFRVERVTLDGDTFQGDWMSRIEAKEFPRQ